MKILCACGTKIAFDVTPDMAQNPVRFVCPNCGLDSSEMVNQLILQELSESAQGQTRPIPTAKPAAAPAVRVVAATDLPPTPGQERVYVGDKARAGSAETAPKFCPKHPGQRPTHRCLVCQKPMCPTCMSYFGYVCSALCKNKAELQGIEVPVYAGQKSVVASRQSRKLNRLLGLAAVCAIALVAGWSWFYLFASRPSVAFSIKFDQPATSGQSLLLAGDQLVYLREGTLARHDIKDKKQIWSRNLVDTKQASEAATEYLRGMRVASEKQAAESEDGSAAPLPSHDAVAASILRAETASLTLHASGQNIWIASPEKIVRYDWATGNTAKEIPIEGGYGNVAQHANELWVTAAGENGETVTRINLTTGEVRADQARGRTAGTPATTTGQTPAEKPIYDPNKLAAKVQGMSFPQKLALPATISIQRNQQQALDEMKSQDKPKPAPTTSGAPAKYFENVSIVPTRDGVIQFSSILLESRIISRKAMKDAPAKSALSGDVSAANTLDVANEVLNDIQRQHGADTVQVDESRYLVTIRKPDARDVPDWRSEVVGPPALFSLKTVTVLAAGNTITVLDKLNKQLWRSTLNFPLSEGFHSSDPDDPTTGQGPCVERGNTLYVFDQGVLAAFDLVTGTARWRLPSVGVAGLFFDDKDNVYVNSTTASPESIKYSHQIDVTSKVKPVIMKIEPESGKILWSTEPGGVISYLSGKFIYALESFSPEEDVSPYATQTGFETPPFIRINRINPSNGKTLWEHFQQRAPLDVHFENNTIEIVFKKEVQVLKYLAF